jgi:citrate synthase
VETWFKQERATGRRVLGMGHRVYKVRDPRAAPPMEDVQRMVEATGDRRWFDIAFQLEQTAMADPYFQERNLSANVDFYSAPLLYSLGIPVDAFTCMFAISRIAGWTAHVYEQQSNNRLIRPISNYTGGHQLDYVPIEERS